MMDESAFSGLPDLFGGQNQFAQNPFSSNQQASETPMLGGISALPLDLQTELKRLSLQHTAKQTITPGSPQDSSGSLGFNPMNLLGAATAGLSRALPVHNLSSNALVNSLMTGAFSYANPLLGVLVHSILSRPQVPWDPSISTGNTSPLRNQSG